MRAIASGTSKRVKFSEIRILPATTLTVTLRMEHRGRRGRRRESVFAIGAVLFASQFYVRYFLCYFLQRQVYFLPVACCQVLCLLFLATLGVLLFLATSGMFSPGCAAQSSKFCVCSYLPFDGAWVGEGYLLLTATLAPVLLVACVCSYWPFNMDPRLISRIPTNDVFPLQTE